MHNISKLASKKKDQPNKSVRNSPEILGVLTKKNSPAMGGKSKITKKDEKATVTVKPMEPLSESQSSNFGTNSFGANNLDPKDEWGTLDKFLEELKQSKNVQSFTLGKILTHIELFVNFESPERKHEWAKHIDDSGFTLNIIDLWPQFWTHQYISDMQNPYSFPTRANLTSSLKIIWQGTLHCSQMAETFTLGNGVGLLSKALTGNELTVEATNRNPIVGYIVTAMLNIITVCLYRVPNEAKQCVLQNGGLKSSELLSKCTDLNVRNSADTILLYFSSFTDSVTVGDNAIKFIITLLQQHMSCKSTDDQVNALVLLNVLNAAAVDDNNKARLVKCDILVMYQQAFRSLMETGNTALLQPMCLLMWNLTFIPELRDKIKRKHSIVRLLTELSLDKSSPCNLEATGALYVIYGKYESISQIPVSDENTRRRKQKTSAETNVKLIRGRQGGSRGRKKKPSSARSRSIGSSSECSSVDQTDIEHIYVSHSINDKAIVKQLYNALSQNQIHVCLNQNNTITSIEKLINKSYLVLICCTDEYMSSPLCRTEATCIKILKKPFMVINLIDGYTHKGWVKEMFTDFEPLQFKEIPEIIQEIQSFMKKSGHPISSPLSNPTSGVDPAAGDAVDRTDDDVINDWDYSNVNKWIKTLHLKGEKLAEKKLAEMDGSCLVSLKNMRNEAPDTYYRIVQDELGFMLSDMFKLTQALDKLQIR